MRTYTVRHRTLFRYSAPISSAQLRVLLVPRLTPRQRVVTSRLEIQPEPEFVREYDDHLGNRATYVSIAAAHDVFELIAESVVEVDESPLPSLALPWERVVGEITRDATSEGLVARDLVLASPHVPVVPEVVQYARVSFTPARALGAATAELVERIFTQFVFDEESSDVTTPLAETFANRRGVCQDFAHLLVGCLRAVGLAARYVSGYIETLPPPGGVKLHGVDASHAWCSFYVPQHGWIDVDPTNNQMSPQRHVTLGWGRDYSDIAPVSGVLFGPPTTQSVEVSVDVTSREEAAATRPT